MSITSEKDLCGKRCAVLGYGRAGRAAAAFLLHAGAHVRVYDERQLPRELTDSLAASGAEVVCGAFPACFEEQILVRSPGIRPDIPPIEAALKKGATLTGESELFAALTPATLIGVTGSDGKTTTATLIAELLRGSGYRVLLGGNNGTPLLPRVGELGAGDFAVLELSSFQLMTWQTPPAVAVLTNLTPNHLNWHTNMAEYAAAKARLLAGAERIVVNADSPAALSLAVGAKRPLCCFSAAGALPTAASAGYMTVSEEMAEWRQEATQRAFDCRAFRLPGRHNLENLLAALCAVLPYLNEETLPDTLSAFGGVPHRLQVVETVRGVRYINSSIDTSPTRTAAALAALGGRPIVLAGGRGKGISLEPLADTLAEHARAVFLYGETAEELSALLSGRVPVTAHTAFADAFRAASSVARRGDTVLLSPGCTAFGEFRDFEERGETFVQLVRGLDQTE